MRIAIISDIHANYQALKEVLEDIKKSKVNNIICLGDIIGKGINVRKCIDLVKGHCGIVLRGNVDDRYIQDPEDWKHDEVEYNRIKFYKSMLTDGDISFLSNLPISDEFYLSGNLVRLFHAHPTSPYQTINNYNIDFREKHKLFEPTEYTKSDKVADIVVFGHLHYQFMEKIYNKTIINCGSVGCSGCLVQEEGYNSQPNEISQAHYIILEGEFGSTIQGKLNIEYKSVSYDKEFELADNQNNPEFDAYYNELTYATYRGLPKAMQKLKDDGYKLFN